MKIHEDAQKIFTHQKYIRNVGEKQILPCMNDKEGHICYYIFNMPFSDVFFP